MCVSLSLSVTEELKEEKKKKKGKPSFSEKQFLPKTVDLKICNFFFSFKVFISVLGFSFGATLLELYTVNNK